MKIRKKNKKVKEKKEEYIDAPLFEFIQPQGGITFKESNHILTGSGYIKVIHIYQLPTTLNDFWMDNIFNIDGTIATVDIATKDTIEVKKNINKALSEEFSREVTATDFMEIYNARKRQAQLQNMFDEIQSMGEVVKMLHFRIFVPGRSLTLLEERCDKIMSNLESDQFMPTVMLNEGKREWESLFEPYEKQHQKPFCIRGHSLMTEQTAVGYPFHYSELNDEYGTFLGFTSCGGPVVFDDFTKTHNRQHYNSLIVGDMGSGKSTLLKKRFEVRAAKGDFIRCFDVSGEFETLTKEFGGKIIKCDGENGILNPLEILRAGDNDFISFSNHITKVSTLFRCFMPSTTDDTIIDFQNILRDFYDSLELTPKAGRYITGLPAVRYPTFSGLLSYINETMQKTFNSKLTGLEEELAKNKLMELSYIEKCVRSLVENYGNIFDGITTIDNIADEKIVTFDISTIKDLGHVFVAQIFNMVSLCWDNAISNGTIMLDKWSTQNLSIEDVVKFFIIIDESHRWINTSMPMILKMIITYMREARKYFAGITLASQSIRDYIPEGTSQENLDLLKTVFELTQYRFMFRQDSSAIPHINQIFNNVLTFSQVSKIPTLGTGDCILCIKGDRNIDMHVWLSEQYEKPLHKGGR